MSAAARLAAAAVDRLVARMAALVASDVPDVAAEPVEGGLRLAGPLIAIRQVEDVRLRALAAQAVRVGP